MTLHQDRLLQEQLKSLSLLEAAELVKQIEEAFGVSAAAPVGVAAEGSAAFAGTAEEQTEFSVVLEGFDESKKIAVLKVVRAITGLGLKEAKDLLESSPKDVLTGVPIAAAKDTRKQLEEAGARVFISGIGEQQSSNRYQGLADNSLKILNSRNRDIKKELLLASGCPLTISAVARKQSTSEEQIEKLRKNRKLIGIPVEKYGYLYPAFQFKEDGSTLAGLDKLLQSLDRFDIWMQLQFLQTGDLRLEGETPINALKQGKLEQALFAAATYAEMCAA
jgi:large subunit ribosomal protein L7/L12